VGGVVEDLTRNAVDVLPDGELERKLEQGRPLRVKFGIDVTSPEIHVGHAIPLQRMRAFQDAGHVGVLIVGDYTTRIGDPSGRSTERPILSDEEIDRNAKAYFEQAKQIIDAERTEVRFNGEWLGRLDFAEVVRLTRTITVARLLERDDFAKRFAAKAPISVSELLYPMMQAYDSVAVQADVELGGTDQLYNLLAGREVMQAYGLEPQVVLTTPLLLGFDGRKMSASLGNYIGLTDSPEDQFGKAMRLSDELLPEYYALVMERPAPTGDPLEAKLELARFIVARSHGEEAARQAEEHFTRVVREGSGPPPACPQPGARNHDESGAPPDRPGRRPFERRARRRARRRRRAAPRRTAPGREAPVLALRGFLTGARSLLSFAGCPEGRRSKVPAPRHWSAFGRNRIRRFPSI